MKKPLIKAPDTGGSRVYSVYLNRDRAAALCKRVQSINIYPYTLSINNNLRHDGPTALLNRPFPQTYTLPWIGVS
ncbi:MAG: hypothetical protein ACTXOO_00325 [Sodalis sp. (in: enterobacteria)]